MKTRVMKLTRVRTHSDAGGGTIFFTAPGLRRRRHRMFFRPDDVPDFEGDEAWFLAEEVPKSGWRIIQRVHPDGSPYAEPSVGHA